MRSKSVKQFCEDHGITKPTFYNEVNAGRIRVFKIGSLTKISDVAEEQYISESAPLSSWSGSTSSVTHSAAWFASGTRSTTPSGCGP